jgi:2-dehydropantoate 2-reductase
MSSAAPRIAIIGAGAIGSVLAVRLAASGYATGVVARGARLAAIRSSGLTLESEGNVAQTVRLQAVSDLRDLGQRDIIFLCLKAHDLAAATAGLEQLLTAGTVIVPVLNGIPWWYFGASSGARLVSTDPDGVLSERFDNARIVGCVVHMAAQTVSPGVVRLTADGPVMVGDADTAHSDAADIGNLMAAAGFTVRAVDDIRREIWIKLAGNAAFNPVSALTGATMREVCARDDLLDVVRAAMHECMSVGAQCGIAFPVTVEQRIAMARKIGGSKLSMLQDLEAGRPVETDALLGSVIELGDRGGLKTPTLTLLRALVSGRARHPFAQRASC